MARYLLTHSLLAAWLYALKEDPYEDMTTERDPMADFMRTLRREPILPTKAMQDGNDFEALVTRFTCGQVLADEPWYDAAAEIAAYVQGGVAQYKVNKVMEVGGLTLVLHGRLDWLKAGEIVDIKFTKSYDRGKYYSSTQHPMYFELVPEARRFTYLVSDGAAVWSESYRRDETKSILPVIAEFFEWLRGAGLMGLFRRQWEAK